VETKTRQEKTWFNP